MRKERKLCIPHNFQPNLDLRYKFCLYRALLRWYRQLTDWTCRQLRRGNKLVFSYFLMHSKTLLIDFNLHHLKELPDGIYLVDANWGGEGEKIVKTLAIKIGTEIVEFSRYKISIWPNRFSRGWYYLHLVLYCMIYRLKQPNFSSPFPSPRARPVRK